MDEESSTGGLGGSASSPWVVKPTAAANTKPIQQSDNELKKPVNTWNNYVSDDNSSNSGDSSKNARDEDNDADESQQQSQLSHLQPEPYSGDQNSSEISSFDRRQISLDISDSSIDERSSSGKQAPSNVVVAEKKKPGILEGLSDEDSSDLSYDYHKSQAATVTSTASSTAAAAAMANTLPTVNTGEFFSFMFYLILVS